MKRIDLTLMSDYEKRILPSMNKTLLEFRLNTQRKKTFSRSKNRKSLCATILFKFGESLCRMIPLPFHPSTFGELIGRIENRSELYNQCTRWFYNKEK